MAGALTVQDLIMLIVSEGRRCNQGSLHPPPPPSPPQYHLLLPGLVETESNQLLAERSHLREEAALAVAGHSLLCSLREESGATEMWGWKATTQGISLVRC